MFMIIIKKFKITHILPFFFKSITLAISNIETQSKHQNLGEI